MPILYVIIDMLGAGTFTKYISMPYYTPTWLIKESESNRKHTKAGEIYRQPHGNEEVI